jgi:hypothetical protein
VIGGGKKALVGTSAASLLCNALGQGTTVLFLNNGTVPVYLGDPTVAPSYGYPCEPLGTLVLPGNQDWYAIADPSAPARQPVNVIPGGIAATPSAAQIALQVAQQELAVQVLNTTIPSRPVLKFSGELIVTTSGATTINTAPGAGQSFYLYLVWINMVEINASGIISAAIEDSTGHILYEVVGASLASGDVDFDGYEVGNNLGIQFAASFSAGGTSQLAQIGYTYSVGAVQ